MKRSEIAELKKRPAAELAKVLAEKQEKLRSLKMDLAMGKSDHLKDIHELKKAVARLQTFIHHANR